jgi:16S rRNA (cytosine967-C5)-methyltransferase
VLADLAGHMDLVLIDAPCTGTGTWRRNPDAKWRLRPGAVEQRAKQQAELLDEAVRFVKPGGRIAFITCSLLPAENDAQVRAFLGRHAGWRAVPPTEVAGAALGERAVVFLKAVKASEVGLTLTPARTDTDGFFLALLARAS